MDCLRNIATDSRQQSPRLTRVIFPSMWAVPRSTIHHECTSRSAKVTGIGVTRWPNLGRVRSGPYMEGLVRKAITHCAMVATHQYVCMIDLQLNALRDCRPRRDWHGSLLSQMTGWPVSQVETDLDERKKPRTKSYLTLA